MTLADKLSQKTTLLFAFFVGLFYAVLFFITGNDPFFGDAISTISRASWHIVDSGFSQISYPPGLDPGHPITFPIIHAVLWKIFGPHLWISHAVNFVFSLLIARWVFRWMRLEHGDVVAYISVLLLLAVPQFISNTAQMNTHLPLTFFALGLAFALRYNRVAEQIIFSSLLLVTHLQGLYVLFPLWIWYFLKDERELWPTKLQHAAKMLVIPAILFSTWLAYHYFTTGWWISSPDYADHRGFAGLKRVVINLVLSDWRIVDYGQIALFIFPILILFKRGYVWSWNDPASIFVMLYFFNAVTISVTTQTGPAHRYLLPCLPFLVMMNANLFREFKLWKGVMIFVILLSGHLWFYPGKVMGDATLAYRSIFTSLDQMRQEFPNETMHSYAPLSNASKFTKLTNQEGDYKPLYNVDLDDVSYVLRSNVSGDFPRSQVDTMQNNWTVKTYVDGYVYLELYANPQFKSFKSTNKRRSSKAERWMLILKRKIKGEDAH